MKKLFYQLALDIWNLSLNTIDQIKKIKNARNHGFLVNEIVKLKLKIDSSLSKLKLRYCLKFRIPLMHEQI